MKHNTTFHSRNMTNLGAISMGVWATLLTFNTEESPAKDFIAPTFYIYWHFSGNLASYVPHNFRRSWTCVGEGHRLCTVWMVVMGGWMVLWKHSSMYSVGHWQCSWVGLACIFGVGFPLSRRVGLWCMGIRVWQCVQKGRYHMGEKSNSKSTRPTKSTAKRPTCI